MTKVTDALSGVYRLGFDTAPIIYFIEAHPTYDALVTRIFHLISSGVLNGLASTVGLTEVLVLPLRLQHEELAQRYRNLLLNSHNFHTLDITPAIAERAADLRARYNLRTPDALHVATAIEAGCQAFLTNDSALKRVSEIKVLLLDELELDETGQ